MKHELSRLLLKRVVSFWRILERSVYVIYMRVGRDNIVYWRVGRCSSDVCVFVKVLTKSVDVVGSSDSVAAEGPPVQSSGWVVVTGMSSGILGKPRIIRPFQTVQQMYGLCYQTCLVASFAI